MISRFCLFNFIAIHLTEDMDLHEIGMWLFFCFQSLTNLCNWIYFQKTEFVSLISDVISKSVVDFFQPAVKPSAAKGGEGVVLLNFKQMKI